jgi:hypothetical protein
MKYTVEVTSDGKFHDNRLRNSSNIKSIISTS